MEQAQRLYRSVLTLEEGERAPRGVLAGIKDDGDANPCPAQTDASDGWGAVVVLGGVGVELTPGDEVRAAGAFVLPWLAAVVPLLLPFGNPFHKYGENGVSVNWAFYFWYVPIGWGFLWHKLILWSCELWGNTYYLPFMQAKAKLLECGLSSLAILISCTGSFLCFLVGFFIFHNPVPFGTVLVGIPLLALCLLCIYRFVIPADLRRTWRDHTRIVRCWIPIVLWVVHIVVASMLVRMQWLALKQLENQLTHLVLRMGMQFLFVVMREAFMSIPPDWFMGDQSEELALLWNANYATVCTGLSGWLFVGVPTNCVGLLTVTLMISATVLVSLIKLYRATDANALCATFISAGCDVLAAVTWLMVFLWAAFGPNNEYIYILRDLTVTEKITVAGMVAVSACASLAKCLVMAKLSATFLEPHIALQTRTFFLKVLRQWYWLAISLLANDCMSCAACMFMMHGGMDFSFKFDGWKRAARPSVS